MIQTHTSRPAIKHNDAGWICRLYRCAVALFILLLIVSVPATTRAGDIELVEDINQMGNSDSTPDRFVLIGGDAFFRASAANGFEIWRLNIATGNLTPEADIIPGRQIAQFFGPMLELDGVLYFVTTTTDFGRELWSHNPVSGVSARITDIQAGPANGLVGALNRVGNSLLFVADDGITGEELWRHTPATDEIVQVRDINPGSGRSIIQGQYVAHGGMYFNANDGSKGAEFWRYDGQTRTAARLADINPGAGSSQPKGFSATFTLLLFAANDGTSGVEPWQYNVITGVTSRVADIRTTGIGSSNPSFITALAGKYYFSANDGVNGPSVWRYDPTTSATTLVADPVPRSNSTIHPPRELTVLNGNLYYSAALDLWQFNPLIDSNVRVVDVGGSPSTPSGLTGFEGRLYYSANTITPRTGTNLWQYDPATDTASVAAEIAPRFGNSSPRIQLGAQGRLLFSAVDQITGRELWQLIPATGEFRQLADLRDGADGSTPQQLTRLGDELMFTADDGINDRQLWKHDPQFGMTSLRSDVVNIQFVTAIGNKLFFSAFVAGQGIGTELFQYDQVTDTTSLVANINPGNGNGNSSPRELFNLNGVLYFSATEGINGIELWRHNPATGSTVRVSDINPGEGSSAPRFLAVVNNQLYFSATDGVSGLELWKHDPAANSTTRVADINPDAGDSVPENLVALAGSLYFTADDGSSGLELWKHDPAADTTTRVADINPGIGGARVEELTVVSGRLFFTAFEPVTGLELWQHDPQTGQTAPVADINPGPAGSNPTELTALGNTLFFSAIHPDRGIELLSHDPASGTTKLVADIRPAFASSRPLELATVGDTLFFSAESGGNGSFSDGRELWRHDSISGDTVQVEDLNPGSASSSPREMTAVGDTLFFSANDILTGTELYKLDLSTPANRSPQIVTTAITGAVVDTLYSYDANASDPDAGDTLSWSLNRQPAGMTIDPSSGLIQWTPADTQVGSNPVTVRVEDGNGGFDVQDFDIEVLAAGEPPAAPEDLAGRAKSLRVNLSWTGSDGATGFRVFRRLDTEIDFAEVGQTDVHAFVDGLPTGTQSAEYFVVAENQFGMSDDSDVITVAVSSRR